MTDALRPIRVAIVDDDALVRAGLRMIVSSADDLEVVAEAADGSAAAQIVRAHRPDVVLMDIRMPTMDGITATAAVRALTPSPAVLILTTFQLDEHVFGALRAGASGFLLKDTPPLEILEAVRLVAGGAAMLSPSVTRTLISHFADATSPAAANRRSVAVKALAALTDREREVAAEVALGRSNGEVAAALYMSEATVKAHVSRLLAKLGVANRVGVAIVVHDGSTD